MHKPLSSFFVLALLVLGGFGCKEASPTETAVTQSETVIATEEPSPQSEHTETNSDEPIFDVSTFIPSEATLIQMYPVDLYGDAGRLEYVVHYHVDNVVSASGKLVSKDYLNIYAWDDMWDDWAPAHEDEIDRSMNDFSVTIAHFTSSPRDYVLVEKPSLPHGYETGYYVFGETNPGYLRELFIQKGYLHEEDYLEDGDTQLYFRGVSATSEGLVEQYDVACESKEYTEPRFGDTVGDNLGPCRRIEISQTLFVDADQTFVQNNSTTAVTRDDIVE